MWATRALTEYLKQDMRHLLTTQLVEEPCANRGYMVRPLREAFSGVRASDIFDYGAGFAVEDYLFKSATVEVDWSVFNPPFKLLRAVCVP